MIYLLDTDVLILAIRGLKSAREPRLRQSALGLVERCRRATAEGDSVGLSAITVAELEYGARNSGRYEVEIAAVHKVLAPFESYPFDPLACPVQYGRIRHALQAAGATIGSMDLLIAAHALALDATLVTENIAHFCRIPDLRTERWLSPESP